MAIAKHYDVVIIGAGLAGLSLARQLLLSSDKTILLLDKRPAIPPAKQKVGESTVQLGAYYFSKVLDLEEHLLTEHYMKYNLRFYWKQDRAKNQWFEDYSQTFIRKFSNLVCYQLDRNKFEAELLRLNSTFRNFTLAAPATRLKVSLAERGPHALELQVPSGEHHLTAEWIVDTSGRNKVLGRNLDHALPNSIHHGASFLWVDGLVDIEKLSGLSPRERRLHRTRQATGHSPLLLATNHFMGEGFWFWVIPLHGKTSLGLVYDNRLFKKDRVDTPQKLIQWACQEFPLFARDLPCRKLLDHGFLRDFSYDCRQTISKSKWARSGEAGRFTDPLYSPGSDLISLHNTLITDAILASDSAELTTKCRLYEHLVRVLYEGAVPAYAISYDALGDQESFTYKYTWELAVYFSFYVFPFINDLFTQPRFIPKFLARFASLGSINRNLQAFVSAFFQWKKTQGSTPKSPAFVELMRSEPLRQSEQTFYRVGVTEDEACRILDEQLINLSELARFIVARITGTVLMDETVLTNRRFIETIDLENLHFDARQLRKDVARCNTGLAEVSTSNLTSGRPILRAQ
jgi:2-polyprenyl-6-methoxyphenol hydroxylase-like FAD-dependent oxidoreductase